MNQMIKNSKQVIDDTAFLLHDVLTFIVNESMMIEICQLFNKKNATQVRDMYKEELNAIVNQYGYKSIVEYYSLHITTGMLLRKVGN